MLGKMLSETDYQLIIKPHPDFIIKETDGKKFYNIQIFLFLKKY